MKENFNSQGYRDNLAKDLKDIRETDPELAQKILTEEKESIRYNLAKKENASSKAIKRSSMEKADPEKYAQNLEVLNSFSFYDDNEKFVESLKNSFKNLDLNGLEKSKFVNLEIKTPTEQRSVFSGTDIAEKLMYENDNSKMLLYAFSDLDMIRGKKPKIDLLLAKENIKFIRLPFTAEDAIMKLNGNENQKIDGAELQKVQDNEILVKVSHLLHMVHISSPEGINYLDSHDKGRLPEMLTEAKLYFPALNNKTDKEVAEFLFAIRQGAPEVMKGENIEGVYCDIEGTLFNGEELNTKTLEMLKDFESQGKNVTLWTDGDITKLQTLLDTAGIKYPLKSKIDHAGASAEIVIDNDDNNTFSAKTKIFAKKFIKI